MVAGDVTLPSAQDGRPAAPPPRTLTYASGVESASPSALPAPGGERYALGAEVARGGMGAVLEAEDRSLRRRVAIKVMLRQDGAADEQVQRFVSEARVTGQLEHPGVVPVYELGTDTAGRVFYAMKLVHGTTLSAILERLRAGDPAALAKYPLNVLLTVFLKVCDAVAFAHSRGVLHRDLKPDNVMVGEYGEVLVLDWGLAKVLGSAEHGAGGAGEGGAEHGPPTAAVRPLATDRPVLTLDGQILGTPAYMAPEQARGEIAALDARTDIYSLGAILYALLVLQPPVQGRTLWEVLDHVVQGHVTPPATHNRTASRRRRSGAAAGPAPAPAVATATAAGTAPSFPHCPGGRIPEALSRVTMKAMALSPEDRYQGVPELQADIEAWRGGFATAAEEAGLWRHVALLVRRHRVVAAASLAVVLALAIGLSVALVQWHRAVVSEREAVTARLRERSSALAAAKRFATQAVRAAETGRWDEAERRVQDAESVSPDGPWAHYARGMFAALRQDYATAADRFRDALKADPANAESTAGLAEATARLGDVEQSLALAARAVDITDWRALAKAGQALYEGGRLRECQAPLARALDLMAKERDINKGEGMLAAEAIRDMHGTARAKVACEGFKEELLKLPPEEQVRRVEAKMSEINGVAVRVPGAGWIVDGEWRQTQVFTEDPAALPSLRFLYPLEGLPLQWLNACNSATNVRDLSPLRGMPLRVLLIGSPKIQDLEPLRGMLLKELYCMATAVTNLEPLRGMPLEILHCGARITDIGPLEGMPLRELSLFGCTGVRDVSLLRSLPLQSLDCGNMGLQDLASLRGLKLTRLVCTNNPIADVSPLQGMPLEYLDCHLCPLGNLAPLAGMPLETLWCSDTQISDLSPLRGAPLKELQVANTHVTDLTPLAGMVLETVGFTPKNITKGLEIVREMKSLKWIVLSQFAPVVQYPPAEFWRRYGAGEFR